MVVKMNLLKAFFVTSMLLVVGGILFIWSGVYNVAATEPHWDITSEVLEVLRERSIESRAEDLTPPESIPPSVMVQAANDYVAMCEQCHLAPGVEPTALHKGLYPQPPAFHQWPGNLEDIRENFWVIKHGLKATGMPAWGQVHSDEEIWALAQFVDYLVGMTPKKYRELTGTVTGSGDAGHSH